MFVLFDQGTPVPIRPFLKEHTVQTTAQRRWDKLENGELLKAAEAAGFNVLVTPDKNIRYQQNLTVRIIIIIDNCSPLVTFYLAMAEQTCSPTRLRSMGLSISLLDHRFALGALWPM